MKIHHLQLTERHVTLIRVALLQRMDRIKERKDCAKSYADMYDMLADEGVLSLRVLNKADIVELNERRNRK